MSLSEAPDNVDIRAEFHFRTPGDMVLIKTLLGAPGNPVIFISTEAVEDDQAVVLTVDVTEFPPDVLAGIFTMLGEALTEQLKGTAVEQA